jgi:hypothetical protein
MYRSDFLNAKDSQGHWYRDKNGNLINHCCHFWLIYPKFEQCEELVAGCIVEKYRKFVGFSGICQECGEVIHIHHDDVVENEEAFEKRVQEILKEKK